MFVFTDLKHIYFAHNFTWSEVAFKINIKVNFILLSNKQTPICFCDGQDAKETFNPWTIEYLQWFFWKRLQFVSCLFAWSPLKKTRSFKEQVLEHAALFCCGPLHSSSHSNFHDRRSAGHKGRAFSKGKPTDTYAILCPAVLSWPTAPGSGRALFGPSCIRLPFIAHQGQNNRTGWVAVHWQRRTCMLHFGL